jgi:hypothetical protein
MLFVKFCGHAEGARGTLFLIGPESGEHVYAQRIILWGELFDPLLHDLSIARGAEASKQLPSDFAHLWPRGVVVNFFHYGREGTAAADRDTEIVDGFWAGRGTQVSELYEDTIHPVRQTAMFEF